MIDRNVLRAIQQADPDGGECEPTEADYARHREWAVDRFGEAAWRAYNTPGWGDDWQLDV